jgi:hypothetical protein
MVEIILQIIETICAENPGDINHNAIVSSPKNQTV